MVLEELFFLALGPKKSGFHDCYIYLVYMGPGAYLHVKNRKWVVSLTRDVRLKCYLALSCVKKCNGKVFCWAHGSDFFEKDDFWAKHCAFVSNPGSWSL